MKKYTLDIDNEEESFFYGLICNEKISRLAWLINHAIAIDLVKENSIEWFNDLENENFYFDKFVYIDELNHLTYTFFSNYDDNVSLFTELRAMKYFILITGGLTFFDEKLFLKNMKSINEIQLISKIDQTRLKQKVNLIL
ncbi:MAG: IPExxxVDY family protein [Bacteroidia bacterium]|nr:IPExxxVDY family protein [Bacteroidia bacterium]